MKTYYCATTSFDDRGRVTAALTNIIEAEEKPENEFRETHRKDIYIDWFESEEEANAFIEQAKSA